MRPEERFLRISIAQVLGVDKKNQLEALMRKDFDWSFLLVLSKKEWLTPLVYRALHTCDFLQLVTQSVRDEMQTVYYKTAVKNASILEKVKEIYAASNAAGITMIPVKGVFIVDQVYQDIGVRPMVDADIVVHRQDVIPFIKLLSAFGFYPVEDVAKTLAKKFSYSLTCSPAVGSADSFHIDVHWHFLSSRWLMALKGRNPSFADIWQRAEECTFEGDYSMLCLSPVDTCMYTAQHAYCHSFDRLLCCADLFALQKLYARTLTRGVLLHEVEKYELVSIISFALTYMEREISCQQGFDLKTRLMRISPCLAYSLL